jgi:hypothetical protein
MSTKVASTNGVPLLRAAPPSLLTVSLVVFFTCLWSYQFPSSAVFDEIATVETFTHRLFPDIISVQQLGWIRLGISAIVWTSTIQVVMSGSELYPFYLPGSKLVPIRIPLTGLRTLCPVTSLWWCFLGASFTLSGYICLLQTSTNEENNNAMTSTVSAFTLRAAATLWTIAAPHTLFISAVVRYIIWPIVLSAGGDTAVGLRRLPILCMHNMNAAAALAEVALLGGLPVRWTLFPVSGLAGAAYIVFSFSMSCSWVDVKVHGPQFLYFFCDTTLPGILPTVILMGFLGAFYVLFGFFVWIPLMLAALPDGLLTHVLFVLVLSSAVMRFRD